MLKFKLDNESLTNDFFENTHLLGIVAPINDYQFCWQLNKLMHFNFRNIPEMEIRVLKKGRNYYFSLYEFKEPASDIVHCIYNNQYDGDYLLPEFKHLDFLWLIKNDDDEPLPIQDVNDIIKNIKSISQVQLVTILTNEKIKNKENLIL